MTAAYTRCCTLCAHRNTERERVSNPGIDCRMCICMWSSRFVHVHCVSYTRRNMLNAPDDTRKWLALVCVCVCVQCKSLRPSVSVCACAANGEATAKPSAQRRLSERESILQRHTRTWNRLSLQYRMVAYGASVSVRRLLTRAASPNILTWMSYILWDSTPKPELPQHCEHFVACFVVRSSLMLHRSSCAFCFWFVATSIPIRRNSER